MVRIEPGYRGDPRNVYFWGDVIQSIIRAFGVVDRGTEYFLSRDVIPWSNRAPVTFRVSVDRAGTYLYNTNQASSGSFTTSGADTVDVPIVLARGENEVKVLRIEDNEESNFVYIETRDIYGWLLGALGLEMIDVVEGINILRSLFDVFGAPIEFLEEMLASRICLRLQPDQDENEFRRVAATYLSAIRITDTLLAIRTAPFGFDNVADVRTGIHHLDRQDVFTVYDVFRDASTMTLAREVSETFLSLPNLAVGFLDPGVYEYVILAIPDGSSHPSHFRALEADVRHWGVPSALILEWGHVGNPYNPLQAFNSAENSDIIYEIYRRVKDSGDVYRRIDRTRDLRWPDRGAEGSETETLSDETLALHAQALPTMRAQFGRRARVRKAGHVTDAELPIYVDNTGPVPQWQRDSIRCMYEEIVPAHVKFSVNYLNDFDEEGE